ncbi:MAG: LPS export ABC transporter permease LptF [Desulfuromonas sp.]|nr:MAG: LPS export ABC transporter permease LptF [Desulfuromonas sp.]
MSSLRLQTYISREIVAPFFLSVVLFTFVLLLSRLLKLIEMVVDKGVAITEIINLFACLLPSFFVITVPLSFLLAVMLAFGRLSSDSEIVAMKAAGFSLYRLALPVVIISLAVCLFTAYLTLFAEPSGRVKLKQRLIDIAYSKAAVALQPQIFNEEFDGLIMYANQVDNQTNTMKGVFISDERMGQTPSIILAERGEIRSDRGNGAMYMHLRQGAIHRPVERSGKLSYQVIDFQDYDVNLSLSTTEKKDDQVKLKAKELSTRELMNPDETLPAEKQREQRVELMERLILPISPLIFALLAVPLGIRSHRSPKGGGFALALFVFLFYYLCLSVTKTMVLESNWPIQTSLWGPTVAFLAVGIILLIRAAKERPLPGSILIVDLFDSLLALLLRRKRRLP